MRSKKAFLVIVLLGAVLGGYLGYIDGSGIEIGILSGMFVGVLLSLFILLLFLRKQKDPFTSLEDEERRSSLLMGLSEKKAPTRSVTQAAQEQRIRQSPLRDYPYLK